MGCGCLKQDAMFAWLLEIFVLLECLGHLQQCNLQSWWSNQHQRTSPSLSCVLWSLGSPADPSTRESTCPRFDRLLQTLLSRSPKPCDLLAREIHACGEMVEDFWIPISSRRYALHGVLEETAHVSTYHDVIPLIQFQWKIPMRLNPFGVCWIHDRLTRWTNCNWLSQVAITRSRHPSNLEGETTIFSLKAMAMFWPTSGEKSAIWVCSRCRAACDTNRGK